MTSPRPPMPGPPRPGPPTGVPRPGGGFGASRPGAGAGGTASSPGFGAAGASDDIVEEFAGDGTGHPAVDAVLQALANAVPLAPADQIAEYEAAHRILQETLASIDRS